MHVPGLKLSGVRSYQGTSRSRLLLPKEEKDRSDTRLKDTSEPQKKDTSEPNKKDRSDRAPPLMRPGMRIIFYGAPRSGLELRILDSATLCTYLNLLSCAQAVQSMSV